MGWSLPNLFCQPFGPIRVLSTDNGTKVALRADRCKRSVDWRQTDKPTRPIAVRRNWIRSCICIYISKDERGSLQCSHVIAGWLKSSAYSNTDEDGRRFCLLATSGKEQSMGQLPLTTIGPVPSASSFSRDCRYVFLNYLAVWSSDRSLGKATRLRDGWLAVLMPLSVLPPVESAKFDIKIGKFQ